MRPGGNYDWSFAGGGYSSVPINMVLAWPQPLGHSQDTSFRGKPILISLIDMPLLSHRVVGWAIFVILFGLARLAGAVARG